MPSIFRRIKNMGKDSRIPTGLYSYRGKGKFAGLSLQLRVESSGEGLLVINANTVLHLNETATAHAYFFMQGMPTEEAVKNVKRDYRIDGATAHKDHERIIYTISTLAETEEVCPISFLNVEQTEPFTQELSAPIRMDLALTFRCQNNCIHCYTGGPQEIPELDTNQWRKIINRLKRIGVFIVTFTGGESTLRNDLPELLKHAQDQGIVSGLITNGRRLKEAGYVKKLVDAGLDFVQITLESHDSQIHDSITCKKGSWQETVEAIKNVVPTPIYATTNTTLNKRNAGSFLETIEFLHNLGLKTFGCNSIIYSGNAPMVADEFALTVDELKELLPRILGKANQLDMKFMWYTPTQYCQLDPLSLGLGVKSCTAARVNMCIGPGGQVYPCQSYFESVGNILEDHWKKIWNHTLCTSLRNREYALEKCGQCPQLPLCGGGCPLELRSEKYMCIEAQ
ncbi:MAG: radical SAM protein [Candidatus Bathyarchaeota archaeon]|nr:MAG: radical SAM protein [Candidatus Bathyarchaeota archaeon]